MPALRLSIAAALAALAVPSLAASAPAGVVLTATLSGLYVHTSAGGSGTAKITFRGSQVCWKLTFKGIDKPTAAGIAKAPPPAGGPSPVFIPLTGLFNAAGSSGCAPRSADKVKAVLANPGGFYVRIKTVKYPNAAIGGRLHKV